MTPQEQSLITGCIRGDKAAWDAFVQQYSPLVYHTIRKTFVTYHAESTSDLVDDLFQDFFLAIVADEFKKLRQFRGDNGCTLASWLRMVAARLTIDELRKRVTSRADAPLELAQPDDTDCAAITDEQLNALSQAIESLPPKDRLLIQFCFRQNLSPPDVAKLLKTSVPAVYTQKSRILSKLRAILK